MGDSNEVEDDFAVQPSCDSMKEKLLRFLESRNCNLDTCKLEDVHNLDISYFRMLDFDLGLPNILPHHQLTTLPREIMLLENLKSMELCHNRIERLPTEMRRLADSLEMLSLSSNRLSKFIPEINHLVSLRLLDLSNNLLVSIPGEIGRLRKLQILNLSSNKLRCLPEEMKQLKSLQNLSLWRNKIKFLPPGIGHLKSLRHLNLRENRLQSLPSEIHGLIALENLNVSANELSSIPFCVGKIEKLTRLWLQGNPLVGEVACLDFASAAKWFKRVGAAEHIIKRDVIDALNLASHLGNEILSQGWGCMRRCNAIIC